MNKSLALIFSSLAATFTLAQLLGSSNINLNVPNNKVSVGTVSNRSNANNTNINTKTSYDVNNNKSDSNSISYTANKNQLFDGITINQAVQGNSAINQKALEITQGATTDLQKARDIYLWIADNITYSTAEANAVDNGQNLGASDLGAIGTFNNKSGICLGYASLYTAMARANGLQVREVYGQGYTGSKWEGHMWNQVYIPSLNQWINVDSTFANAFFKAEKNVGVKYNPIGALSDENYVYVGEDGQQWNIQPQDYFNSANFNSTHRNAQIVGQWS